MMAAMSDTPSKRIAKRAVFSPETPVRRRNPAITPAKLGKVFRKVQESLSKRAKGKPGI